MAKARPIGELNGSEPMGLGAARIVRVRTSELADHSREVLELGEIEHLHDMRVATRRLRAALEVFEACFPSKAHATVLAEVKGLADALGERRDRDVAIASLQAFGQGLAAPDRRGVQSLVETLRLEQIEANEALRPSVGAGARRARCASASGSSPTRPRSAARPPVAEDSQPSASPMDPWATARGR